MVQVTLMLLMPVMPVGVPGVVVPGAAHARLARMRNLYVVTHPEADHHVRKLVGGWYDSALTDRGIVAAQRIAADLGERIPRRETALLFSSDLRRTRQTADPIGQRLGLSVHQDRNLREQTYGIADGTPAGSTPYLPPPPHGDRMHHWDGNAGSEMRFQLAGRAYTALHRMLAAGAQDTVAVTHGGTATYLVAAWIGLPLEAAGYVKFQISPGSITHLREDDVFHDRQVVSLNDTAHL
ncbi:histidine phosphatase family protein [Arthrobacter yangruifuii]|nr:histidine phosphatase family protein [Arthrobacter yangruifuii]